MKWALGIWTLVLVSTIVAAGCFDGKEAPGGADRRVAPTFELVRLDGIPVSLESYKGQTVILDFWATWCAPCEVQMPILDGLYKRRSKDGLMVLGVSLDTDPPAKVAEWLRERKIEYPIAIADQQLAVDYGTWAFPTLVVVDPSGRIYKLHQGVLSRPELEDILDAIDREFAGIAAGGEAA